MDATMFLTNALKAMARRRRLRPFRATRNWFNTFFYGALPLATMLLIWGLMLQGALLYKETEYLRSDVERLRAKLQDTEMMLIRCFDGSTAAYVDLTLPSGQVVREYQECPKKVERRIYP